ncbi:hypothetical protein CCR75_000895 [Bremia lactucae]|uniref:Hpc2-related domain-containing protein n=1 Tax=Bremia lactucae TaxID=4779 RepID=A0A976IFR3_BRELC|nr:hypothetical protein CCR75_000895 [Bremia lactucae]
MSPSVEPKVSPPKPRQTFHIPLDSSSPVEISFKQLLTERTRQLACQNPTSTSPSNVAASIVKTMENSVPASRPQRFNIIEHLEKRYGGGIVRIHSINADVGGGGGFNRRVDDDLYDSEDSFIDDAELQQNIEDVQAQTRVKTKHSGFFVNAGDTIEMVAKDDDDECVDRGKKRGGDGALRSFRATNPDAASDWQPDDNVVNKLEALRTAVQECKEIEKKKLVMTMDSFFLFFVGVPQVVANGASIPKVFPRSLDESLRAVDKLVVEAHPNKWRVTGYFATLMTFLPYTKQYLKSNMLRLEARDVAKMEKEKLDRALEPLMERITTYALRATTEPFDGIKTDIAKDKELGTLLHMLLEHQDAWVLKENDYRQMLKTEDKKHMKELDFKPLNQRQERNRMFNRVLALFPLGLTDLQTLRGLNKAAKTKGSKKALPQKPAVKHASTKKKTTEPTSAGTVPMKRSIKPFKSRMMDDAPPFKEDDFEDVEP